MILITGGAGYIGSHCVLALLERNEDIVVFDNLSTGHSETIDELMKIKNFNFIRGDLRNEKEIEAVFAKFSIDLVLHFAAFSQIGESNTNPQKYYMNNICGSLNLLKVMLGHNVKKIVFSSTASIYGEPDYVPIDENHPQTPINTYGKTKLMIETIMDDYAGAYGLKSIRLRYFNVAGADTNCRIGEWHEPETHLIPNILKSTLDNKQNFKIYGTNYNTKDGSCIRDYINVEDLVNAHILAIEYLNGGGETDYFNLGSNFGYSVKEIVAECEKVLKKRITVKTYPQRDGDPVSLIASNVKASRILNWTPQKSITQSIISAYDWELRLSQRKKS